MNRMSILRYQQLVILAPLAGVFLGIIGCKENARLADHKVRDRSVQTISAYGKVLDQAASPLDVVYVFLKAVLDDYDAADDQEKRELAFDTQLGTLATERIKKIVAEHSRSEQQKLDSFYATVRRFAPVVGHYREDFRLDYETLTKKMFVAERQSGDASSGAIVLVNLDHPDPKLRPNGNVIARFDLVREAGYWRIWWVSFDNTARDWKQKKYRGRSLAEVSPSGTKTQKP